MYRDRNKTTAANIAGTAVSAGAGTGVVGIGNCGGQNTGYVMAGGVSPTGGATTATKTTATTTPTKSVNSFVSRNTNSVEGGPRVQTDVTEYELQRRQQQQQQQEERDTAFSTTSCQLTPLQNNYSKNKTIPKSNLNQNLKQNQIKCQNGQSTATTTNYIQNNNNTSGVAGVNLQQQQNYKQNYFDSGASASVYQENPISNQTNFVNNPNNVAGYSSTLQTNTTATPHTSYDYYHPQVCKLGILIQY